MKKVITMVGTSLFDNFFKANESSDLLFDYYEELKEKPASEYEIEEPRIKKFKRGIKNWIKELSEEEKFKASAEVKSLQKLKEELKDELEVWLLASDSIISRLAGEIVKEVIEELEIGKSSLCVISGLQVKDRNEFKKGMSNLITKIYEISQSYWENVIINITGGFKAAIPFLTILAQLNGCPVYYIFEDTDALIKIPNIPFSQGLVNYKELEAHFEILMKLEKGITEEEDYHKLKNSEFYQKYSFLIWEDPPLAELNPIGKIFLEKYKEKVFVFYGTEEVEKKISNSPALKRTVLKLADKFLKEKKTQKKNEHLVFDDGNNQFRVFYREDKGQIFVYKVFDDHDKYEQYLNSAPYSEELLNTFSFKPIKLLKEE